MSLPINAAILRLFKFWHMKNIFITSDLVTNIYVYIYAVSALAALFDREQIIIFTVNTWLRFSVLTLLSIVEHEMNMELTLTKSITEWRLGQMLLGSKVPISKWVVASGLCY